MTPLELERALEQLYGEHWKTTAPEALGLNRTTLWRYVSCETEIPTIVAVAVTALLELRHVKSLRQAHQRTYRRAKKGADRG